MNGFERRFTAARADIDELGHVNNAVWVRWVQEMAVAHWEASAPAEHQAAFFWVVVRHEIDYPRPLREGESVTARTWVGDAPRGARFDRFVEFSDEGGATYVRAKTTWAIIDRESGRVTRVPRQVAATSLA